MVTIDEITEIIRYTKTIQNDYSLLLKQCELFESVLASLDINSDFAKYIIIEKALAEYSEFVYPFDRYIEIQYQYASNLLYKSSNYTECLDIFTKLLLIPTLEQHHKYFNILIDIGSLYSILGQMDRAKVYFLKAQKLTDNNWQKTFRVLAKQANLLYKENKHFEALSLLESLLENTETIDSNTIAGVCLTIGTLYSRFQDSQKAIDYFVKADLLRDPNNTEFAFVLKNNLGNLYSRMYDLDLSASYYVQSLQIALKTEKLDYIVGSYISLSSLEIQRENLKEARVLLETACKYVVNLPKTSVTPHLYERLAFVYVTSDEEHLLQKSKELLDYSISVCNDLQLNDVLASTYWVYSLYYKRQSNSETQLHYLLDSHKLSLQINSNYMVFFTALELSSFFILHKENVTARTYLEISEKLFEQLHKGYQENHFLLLYLVKSELAMLENRFDDSKMYFDAITTMGKKSNDKEFQTRLKAIQLQLNIQNSKSLPT